jgi:hypothetical protein
MPLSVAQKGENYKEITMIQVIEKCEEFLAGPIPKFRNTVSFKDTLVQDRVQS